MPHRSRSERRLWPWLTAGLLAVAMLAGCQSLEIQQRKWIFMPSQAQPWSETQTLGMDDVWIEHQSAASGTHVKLHALWYAAPDAQAPLLLYLHGARRNVAGSAFRIRQMQQLGFSVLAVDYRGFGKSSDELPSEELVYEDARAAWAWLAREHPTQQRCIFGHSLGGAIAVQLATEVDDAKGVIVEGTFTSIPDVFESMRWGWLPITPLITQRFDSAGKVGRVRMPMLVVHGANDALVSPELGRALYELAPLPKRFVLVEGGTHYSTNGLGQQHYRDAMRELFGLGT
ncbi:MAG: alpha/beta fold hydrolase [Burkholderiales bacterium]|nr:alpha/beta fold hydrolase [Burkholderiales bacterium]